MKAIVRNDATIGGRCIAKSEVRDQRTGIRRTEDSLRPRGAYAPAGGQTAEISEVRFQVS